MIAVTKYVADDGSQHDTKDSARRRDALLVRVAEAVAPLGERIDRELWSGGTGYVQHDPDVVDAVRVALLRLARVEFPASAGQFPDHATPFSIAGRVLDDCGGPLNRVWGRLMCIDATGREWEQPYFALHGNPDASCVESRRIESSTGGET